MNPAPYVSFLQQVLTPPRLEHSLGVMAVMGELAEIYGLNKTQAMTAGLLHDAAKDLTPNQLLTLAQEADLVATQPWETHPVYLHAPVGAYVAAKALGVTDQAVLDAIFTHSFGEGDNFNATLSWCLRLADILAPVKQWPGMKKLAGLVYAGRLAEASLLQCGWLLEYFAQMDIPFHPHLITTFEALSAELNATPTFFERW